MKKVSVLLAAVFFTFAGLQSQASETMMQGADSYTDEAGFAPSYDADVEAEEDFFLESIAVKKCGPGLVGCTDKHGKVFRCVTHRSKCPRT